VKPTVSLRFTLSAIISLLALTVVAMVSAILIDAGYRQDEIDLQHKAVLYAGFFANELESAIAFGDHQTAREVLSGSASLDQDIESVGLFREDGSILEERGTDVPAPWAASPPSAQLRVSDTELEALAPVVSREGPRGVVVLRMSRAAMKRVCRAAALNAVAVGAGAVGMSILCAFFVSGWVSRRLGRIVAAASSVAKGDLRQPPLDPGLRDEIGHLALSFNGMVARLRDVIETHHAAEAAERHRLEQLVGERTREIEARSAELQESHERYRLIAETANAIPWEMKLPEGTFTYVGPQAVKLLGHSLELWKTPTVLRNLVPVEDLDQFEREATAAMKSGKRLDAELRIAAADGRLLDLRCVTDLRPDENQLVRGLLLDVTQRKKLESGLLQSQKLESIGRLASGIAEQIDAPIQSASDASRYLREAFDDLLALLGGYRQLRKEAEAGHVSQTALAAAREAEASSDIEYVSKKAPEALGRCHEGLGRVGQLIRSMQEFAQPTRREKSQADLNHALAATLTVAGSEIREVAEVETSFGDIPQIYCHAGELNQALLAIIVNAAQAVGEVVGRTSKRGVIRIETRREGNNVVVAISDSGAGIPAAVQPKIFDPFFTTKPIGKRTGNGLSVARNTVVDKHGGSMLVDSEVGRGTTFTIRLPISGGMRRAA
jgi:PAS domain S-box-containing protein